MGKVVVDYDYNNIYWKSVILTIKDIPIPNWDNLPIFILTIHGKILKMVYLKSWLLKDSFYQTYFYYPKLYKSA